jgi:hypothetical protein
MQMAKAKKTARVSTRKTAVKAVKRKAGKSAAKAAPGGCEPPALRRIAGRVRKLAQLQRQVTTLEDIHAVRAHFKYGYYIDMPLR